MGETGRPRRGHGQVPRPLSAPRTRQQGSFTLPNPPDEAFDLFTAEGERRWVDGWEPVILSDCGATEPGAVFLTDHGGEATIRTVLEANRAAGRLAYSRVSPGRRAGIVHVRLGPNGAGTRVEVAYDITSLGPDADDAVRAMDEAGFAGMLDEWSLLIHQAAGEQLKPDLIARLPSSRKLLDVAVDPDRHERLARRLAGGSGQHPEPFRSGTFAAVVGTRVSRLRDYPAALDRAVGPNGQEHDPLGE